MSQAHPVSFPDFPKLTSPASPKKNGHSRKIAAGDEAAIFDLIPASVVVLDREHTIVDLNETAARTAGRSKQTCVGLKVWDIFDNPDCRAGTCAASQAVKSGLRCEGVGRPLIQGKEVPVLISAAPRLSSEGEIIGVVEVILPTLGDVALSEEIQRLAEAAKAGRLSDRIPENRFDGRHLGTVRLINQMMDAMMQPIRMTTQYLGLLSQGKIPEKITDDYEGDLNTIKNDLNECGNALRGLAEVSLVLERMAVNDLSVNATEGYPGIFGKLCHSVNEAQGRVRNAIRVVKQVAIGDFRQELEILEQVGKRSDMDEFVPAFITMMRSLGALVSDAEMLADAAAAGKFDTRADAAKHNGQYRSVVAGVNTTLDIVVDKLNWYQSIIDALPLPIHVLDKNMNWVFLNKAFERLMVQNKIVRNREEAQGLPCSNAAASICKTAGCGVRQLEMGTNESYFDWHGQECKQETSKLVNLKGEHIGYVEAVQDLTEIVRNRQYTKHEVERLEANLTKLAQGDFALDLQIADADQHTAESNAQFAKISSNLAKVKSAVQAMCADAEMLVRAAVDGSLTTRADASKHGGDFRKIVEGVNSTLDAVIGPLNVAADYVDKISKGQIPPRIDENYNGDFNAIKNNLNRCIDALNGLTNEMRRMSDAHNAGDIDALIPLDKFDGAYRTMADGVNEMVAGHITVKKKAMACIAEFGKGNFEASLDRFPGKKAFINDTIEAVRANLKALITDTNLLVQAAVQGKLSTRADAGKHGGDFRKIVEGVNATLDAVIGPLQEVGQVLDKMAGGDLTVQAVNEYAGDFNRLRNTVNTLASQFRSAIQQIGANANSLVSAAEELNKVSQQMGASADETATQANVVSAASEQVAANVQTVATGADEMGASIKEIAKNTADATRVAMAAVKSAEATNETIGKLGQSSAEIGQVIKVITSIAQQTNLLALNATIEAARAGEAGKGFAVVANEVKELAKETAKATEDISRKIEAIQGDTKGAVAAIGQIGSVIVQINDIQNTIASAVEEQSATTNEISRNLAEAAHGSSDITRNIGGVAEAARSTTAGAMDTQKSAQSLERMSAELQGLISQFKF